MRQLERPWRGVSNHCERCGRNGYAVCICQYPCGCLVWTGEITGRGGWAVVLQHKKYYLGTVSFSLWSYTSMLRDLTVKNNGKENKTAACTLVLNYNICYPLEESMARAGSCSYKRLHLIPVPQTKWLPEPVLCFCNLQSGERISFFASVLSIAIAQPPVLLWWLNSRWYLRSLSQQFGFLLPFFDLIAKSKRR